LRTETTSKQVVTLSFLNSPWRYYTLSPKELVLLFFNAHHKSQLRYPAINEGL